MREMVGKPGTQIVRVLRFGHDVSRAVYDDDPHRKCLIGGFNYRTGVIQDRWNRHAELANGSRHPVPAVLARAVGVEQKLQPLVPMPRLGDCDQQKRRVGFVLAIELLQLAKLAKEKVSGEAAQEQHDGFALTKFVQMHHAAVGDSLQDEISCGLLFKGHGDFDVLRRRHAPNDGRHACISDDGGERRPERARTRQRIRPLPPHQAQEVREPHLLFWWRTCNHGGKLAAVGTGTQRRASM